MRIGLLADIHEAVEPLREALRLLKAERVERFAMLGDVFETGQRLDETVAVLTEAGVELGVWGNHDIGLCLSSPEELGAGYRPETVAYMRGLRPRIEVEGYLFQHIPPSFDPTTIEGMWSCFDHDFLTDPIERDAFFASFDRPVAFSGHFHDWIHATSEGISGWRGEAPLRLDPSTRRFVTIHAVVDRACAVLDTDRQILKPIRF